MAGVAGVGGLPGLLLLAGVGDGPRVQAQDLAGGQQRPGWPLGGQCPGGQERPVLSLQGLLVGGQVGGGQPPCLDPGPGERARGGGAAPLPGQHVAGDGQDVGLQPGRTRSQPAQSRPSSARMPGVSPSRAPSTRTSGWRRPSGAA